jgi:hypothetical protein
MMKAGRRFRKGAPFRVPLPVPSVPAHRWRRQPFLGIHAFEDGKCRNASQIQPDTARSRTSRWRAGNLLREGDMEPKNQSAKWQRMLGTSGSAPPRVPLRSLDRFWHALAKPAAASLVRFPDPAGI